MDHWFDDLAASLAVKTSRRRSLKLFAAGIGGVVAASVHGRLRHAAAKPTQAAPSVAYPPGWNLVAGPAGSTVSGAVGALFTLQAGDAEYETVPNEAPLQACVGYWTYFPSGGRMTMMPGLSTCSAALADGQWVMVGNPSATAPVAVSGADVLYTYSPDTGYVAASVIPVGQGAWATGSTSATLTALPQAPVPAPVIAVAAPPPAAAPAPVAAPTQTPPPVAAAPPPSGCCRVCSSGCACGNSCISCRDRCHQPPGCAC